MEVLSYLRLKNLVHRDLKPANLLLNEKFQLVLADFGTAKVVKDKNFKDKPLQLRKSTSCSALDQHHTYEEMDSVEEEDMVGTEEYMSPEAINCERDVSFESDLWSLGVIIYQIFSRDNKTPFHSDDTHESVFDRIRTMKYEELPEDVSEDARDLVSKLLVRDPSQRLGAKNINELKCHQFFD